jgi:hypothetical protein
MYLSCCILFIFFILFLFILKNTGWDRIGIVPLFLYLEVINNQNYSKPNLNEKTLSLKSKDLAHRFFTAHV